MEFCQKLPRHIADGQDRSLFVATRIEMAIKQGWIDFVEVAIGAHFTQAALRQVAWLRERCVEFDPKGLNEAVIGVYRELYRIACADYSLLLNIRPQIGPMTTWTGATVELVRNQERFCGSDRVG